MLQTLFNLAASFPEMPMIASREMRKLLESERDRFADSALALAKTKPYHAGHQYALTLLVTNNMVVDKLADPKALDAGDAVEISKRIQATIDSFLDVKLVRMLVPNNLAPPAVSDPVAILRVLEIIGAISDGSRIMTLLTQLLNHTDSRVRSKVALLVGRINHNLKWVEQRLTEPDERVRANAVESLWGIDSAEAQQIFQTAMSDPDNRVAGNGALGLYRCGELSSAEALLKMLASENRKFRATAAWAMGETADPRFLPQLSLRIAEPDANVRQNVFRAIAKIRKRVKELQEVGKLQVTITRVDTNGSTRKLQVAVLRGHSHMVKFGPPEVVVTDNGSVVAKTSLYTRREPDHLTAVFVLPRLINREEELGRSIFDSLRSFLRHKRKLDGWAATKYTIAAPVQPAAAFRLEAALLSSGSGGGRAATAEQAEARVEAEPIRFTTDPRALLQICETVGMRASAAESPQEAVRNALDAMTLVRGQRWLFVFVGEGATNTGWDELRPLTRDARVTISAIGCCAKVPEGLAALARESGGSSVEVSKAEQILPAAERLGAGMASLHTIEYELPNGDNGPVKIQIYSTSGFGEDTV